MPVTTPQSGVRPGTVMHFAASTPPPGWLVCNGAAVSRSTYAALFLAVGTTYGAGDGSTTFNLPDLRGEFLRGWDAGRGVDSGRGIGTGQSHSFAAHQHTGATYGAGLHAHSVWGDASGSGPNGQVSSLNGGNYPIAGDARAGGWIRTNGGGVQLISDDGTHTHTYITDNTGGDETRPRNVAMLPCIKF